MMKALIRLFLILITLTVIVVSWLADRLSSPRIQLLIVILVAISLAVFLILNLLDRREQKKERIKKESRERSKTGVVDKDQKRSDTSFRLRERKSGLTWGGGNIKASEATRGTKRKFLGR